MERVTPGEMTEFYLSELDRQLDYYSESIYKDIDWLAMIRHKEMAKLRQLSNLPIYYEAQSKTHTFLYVYEGDVTDIIAQEKRVGLNRLHNEASRVIKETYGKPDSLSLPWNAVYFKITRDTEGVHFKATLCFFMQSRDNLIDEAIDELTCLKGKEDTVREEGIRKVAYSLLATPK